MRKSLSSTSRPYLRISRSVRNPPKTTQDCKWVDNCAVNGVHYYELDLTDSDAIESTAEKIRREHGDPTVLINNAGIGGFEKFS